MKYGLSTLLILAFAVVAGSSLFGGALGWVVLALLVICLVGLIAYLAASGMFVPPTTLIDDVKNQAVKARDIVTKPVSGSRPEDD